MVMSVLRFGHSLWRLAKEEATMSNAPSPRVEQAPRGKRRQPVGCLVAGAGLLFLTCCGSCMGLGVLDAVKKGQEKAAAQDAPPEPAAKPKADPLRPYPVGLRKLTFTYQPKEGPGRQRKVMLWYPTTGQEQPYDYLGLKGFATPDAPLAPGAHPVLLFSHGYRGAAGQTIFLMEAFAREGYIVAAVDHADALPEKHDKPFDLGQFFDVKSWNDSKFRDRRDDLVALLDHLFEMNDDKESYLHEHIDKKAIGAAGHSLGGYTVLGTVGGWPDWRDERIRAALLLSAYTLPFAKTFDKVETPVMLQGGTHDWGITPFLPAAYDGLAGPKYFLVLKKANHFEWTNFIEGGKTTTDLVKQGNAKLITDYSIAFFNHHLGGEAAPLLEQKAEGLESYRFKAEAKR
jgi:predicted dienelactone hydrolase